MNMMHNPMENSFEPEFEIVKNPDSASGKKEMTEIYEELGEIIPDVDTFRGQLIASGARTEQVLGEFKTGNFANRGYLQKQEELLSYALSKFVTQWGTAGKNKEIYEDTKNRLKEVEEVLKISTH